MKQTRIFGWKLFASDRRFKSEMTGKRATKACIWGVATVAPQLLIWEEDYGPERMGREGEAG